MKIKCIIITFAIMMMGVHPVYAQTINQKFAQELQQKSSHVNSIKCQFTQTRAASFLAENVEKSGTFYFKIPENILLSYADGDYIIMTDDWFKMKTASQVNKMKIASNPMLRNLKSILSACIHGDLSKLTKDFEISVTSIPTGWELIMKPKKKRVAAKLSQIILNFEKDNMSLNLMKMMEKSGDYTEYKFYDKKFNVAIEDSLFSITK